MAEETPELTRELGKAGMMVVRDRRAGGLRILELEHVVKAGKRATAAKAKALLEKVLERLPETRGRHYMLETGLLQKLGRAMVFGHVLVPIPRGPPGKGEDARVVLARYGFEFKGDSTKGGTRTVTALHGIAPGRGGGVGAEMDSAKRLFSAVLRESPTAFGRPEPEISAEQLNLRGFLAVKLTARWKAGPLPPAKAPAEALSGKGFHYLPGSRPYLREAGGWIRVDSVGMEPDESDGRIVERRADELRKAIERHPETFGTIVEQRVELAKNAGKTPAKAGRAVRVIHKVLLQGK